MDFVYCFAIFAFAAVLVGFAAVCSALERKKS
jgi:hypothetical protein